MTTWTDRVDEPQAPQQAPAQPAAGTATIEREETRELVEPGDAERFAHYVKKEKILESAMTGEPVIALCGKVWVPGRDPNKFPVCPACKDILDGVFGPGDDGDGGES
jgi:hypothetical protein